MTDDHDSEGDLTPSDGPVSLFIDMIGRPMTLMSVAGVRRRGPVGEGAAPEVLRVNIG